MVLRRWLRAAFVVLAAVILALAAGGLVVAHDLYRTANERYLNQLIPQRASSRDLVLQLVNEETAVRGFVITAKESSLAPYAPARSAADTDVATLNRLARSDEPLRTLVGQATGLRAQVETYFAGEIALVRSGEPGRERAAARVEAGTALFDRFRKATDRLLALAYRRTDEVKSAQSRYYTELAALVLVAGIGALLIVIALGLVVPRRAFATLREQERARMLAEGLQRLGAELAAAPGVGEVLAALGSSGRPALAADGVSVGLLAADTETVDIWHSWPAPAATAGRLLQTSIQDDSPGTAAIRDGRARIFHDLAMVERAHPGASAGIAKGGFRAVAVLPLRPALGTARGYLEVFFRDAQAFGEQQRNLLATVASQVQQALDRAESYDRERRTAGELQRALLPDRLPSREGLVIRGRYEAGGVGLTVGGDWYEAVERAGGVIAASVGDVAGKGVGAAVLMGRLRHSYRAYALEGHGPAAVLARLTRHVRQDDMATVLCLDIDADGRTLRYCAAGHLPAVLLDAERGTTTLLDVVSAPPLGVATADEFEDTTVALPKRPLLLAYTDGLIERRDIGLEERIASLSAVVREAAGGDADRFLSTVVERMRGDRTQADDLAILAISLGGAQPPAPHGGPGALSSRS